MKRLLCATAALALFPLVAAHAGSVFASEVNVNTTTRTAYGTLKGARYSSDSVQFIYCNVRSGEAYCYAKDKNGVGLGCYTTSPGMVQAAGSVGPASYINFTADASGYCSWLLVSNESSSL